MIFFIQGSIIIIQDTKKYANYFFNITLRNNWTDIREINETKEIFALTNFFFDCPLSSSLNKKNSLF